MHQRLAQTWPVPLTIAVLWAASLALPALTAGGRSFSGLEMLIDGWQGAPRGVYAWFANPLFLVALAFALFARDAAAAAIAAAAMLLGLTSVFVEPALRERMTSVPEIELRVGFYVWMVALTALCLGSWARALSARRKAFENGNVQR